MFYKAGRKLRPARHRLAPRATGAKAWVEVASVGEVTAFPCSITSSVAMPIEAHLTVNVKLAESHSRARHIPQQLLPFFG
jgi:hypothetical protein